MVFVSNPLPKRVLKNPTPDNVNDITYIDDNDVCYKYKKIKTGCHNGSDNVNTVGADGSSTSNKKIIDF